MLAAARRKTYRNSQRIEGSAVQDEEKPAALKDALSALGETAQPSGDGADSLFAQHYADLKRLAHSRLYAANLRGALSTESLLHESFMRLAALPAGLSFETRAHFFSYASRTMRNIIVDTVREKNAERRGGGVSDLSLRTDWGAVADLGSADLDIERVHDSLLALESIDAGLAKLVEMRFFGGLTEPEIATALGVSERTVRRDWTKARAALLVLLEES
jgi:RNA polymerase sigma factor (TIGR02999 family)